MKQSDIAAVVLAAGYSRRMGSFKPLLELDGQPVISRVVDSLRSAGVQDVRVVAGYGRESLLPVLKGLQVRTIINDRYADGMFSSVLAGLGSLEPQVKAFFLLPADMPLIRPATYRYLMEMRERHAGKILIPVFMGRKGHPPLIQARFMSKILRYSGDDGLRGALAGLKDDTVLVPVADEGMLFDMDTSGKYFELQARWQRRHIPTLTECEAISAICGVSEQTQRHCRVVSEVAGELTDELNQTGYALDRDLIVASALLHDLARDKQDHAREASRLVTELGFPEAAGLISTHMDIAVCSASSVSAAEVLYLADKLVREDRRVSLAERFDEKLAHRGEETEAANRIRARYRTACSIGNRIVALTGSETAVVM